jgi:hypothetical protein
MYHKYNRVHAVDISPQAPGGDCEEGMVFSVNAADPDAIVKAAKATGASKNLTARGRLVRRASTSMVEEVSIPVARSNSAGALALHVAGVLAAASALLALAL